MTKVTLFSSLNILKINASVEVSFTLTRFNKTTFQTPQTKQNITTYKAEKM
jgi:hypothetical protein